jgi:hypothetical protein
MATVCTTTSKTAYSQERKTVMSGDMDDELKELQALEGRLVLAIEKGDGIRGALAEKLAEVRRAIDQKLDRITVSVSLEDADVVDSYLAGLVPCTVAGCGEDSCITIRHRPLCIRHYCESAGLPPTSTPDWTAFRDHETGWGTR